MSKCVQKYVCPYKNSLIIYNKGLPSLIESNTLTPIGLLFCIWWKRTPIYRQGPMGHLE